MAKFSTLINPDIVKLSDILIKVGNYTSHAQIGVGGNSIVMDHHGFEDSVVIDSSASPNLGYASFDAQPELTGNSNNSHLVGFQSRPIYNSSGNLTDYLHGIDISAQHIGAGIIASAAQLNILDISGAGTVTTDYGIYIGAITRGSTNYSIYSAGGPAYFSGSLTSGGAIAGGSLSLAGEGISTYKLAVSGDIYARGNVIADYGTGFFNNIIYNSGWKFIRTGYGNGIYNSGANLIFSSFGTGAAGAAATEIQAIIMNNGKIGLGVTPTAILHLKAATAAANTASLKIDAGIIATTPVTGNIESDGTHLYWTDSGGTRRTLDNA